MPRPNALPRERAPVHDAVHAARPAVGDTQHIGTTESFPTQWKPANNMPDIPPLPGMRHKWVRDPITPDSHETSWSRSYGEGWRPRDPATVPLGQNYRSGKNIHGADCIRRGNMVLCHMPETLWKQREQHYAKITAAQYDAKSREATGNLPHMKHDDEMTVTVARGPRSVSPMTD